VAALVLVASDVSVAFLSGRLTAWRGADTGSRPAAYGCCILARRPTLTMLRMSEAPDLDEDSEKEKHGSAGVRKGTASRSLLRNAPEDAGSTAESTQFRAGLRRMRRSYQSRESSSSMPNNQIDAPEVNTALDGANPDRDYERLQPGHGGGKSVLSLTSIMMYVPYSPAAPSATQGAAGAFQTVVCSGGHDGQVKLWRLQTRARLAVGDEMCVQAPHLMPVGQLELPQNATSVFSLAEAGAQISQGATESSAKNGVRTLLVGEGKSRQVSRWQLRVEGSIPPVLGAGGARVPDEQIQNDPSAAAGEASEEDANDSSAFAKNPAGETLNIAKSWGWQMEMPQDFFDEPPADHMRWEQEEADNESTLGAIETDEDLPDDAGTIGADGFIKMYVKETERAKAQESGGWRVEGIRLNALPELHTGWVRSIATDSYHMSASDASPLAHASGHFVYSVGCNYIKVWHVPLSQQQTLSDGATPGAAAVDAVESEDAVPRWLGDLEVHGDILCVAACSGRLVSGSVDGSLRVWDMRPYSNDVSQQELKATQPFVVDAHDGRLTAAVLVQPLQQEQEEEERQQQQQAGNEEEEEEEETRKELLFTCGHDGFVRSWSFVDGIQGSALQLEAELDVIAVMGLHAEPDERLLCIAASPPDTGKPILGNMQSTCGRCCFYFS